MTRHDNFSSLLLLNLPQESNLRSVKACGSHTLTIGEMPKCVHFVTRSHMYKAPVKGPGQTKVGGGGYIPI